MESISSKEFVFTFCNDIWSSNDRRVCFVLGAGASKSSGIKTGGELAKLWLDEIEKRIGSSDRFQRFLKEKDIDAGWPGASYSDIYQERFRLDIPSGFDYINKEMETARPGYGYSVLAQVLAQKQHNIVITTNFDNLTEEALYTYTTKRPLVCGHESLAAFARPSMARPLIVKIHRDRFFSPLSRREEIDAMNKAWIEALNKIFQNNIIPVFIGYGGNDGSLMGYLEQITQFDNLFWCERKGTGISERVKVLLEKHNGKHVEIEGFDELMFLLQDGLKLPLLNAEIRKLAEERAKNYEETVTNIQNKQLQSADPDVQQAAKGIVEKAGDDWWAWQLRTDAAKDDNERDVIYQEAIITLPNSSELCNNYALFLTDTRKEYDSAEIYYKKALEINSNSINANGNYAQFLHVVRKDQTAEVYYKKAINLDPKDPGKIGNYALFLKVIQKDYAEAEKYYLIALEIDPDHANNNNNYGAFLESVRKDYTKAKKHYEKALAIEPEREVFKINYENLLKEIKEQQTIPTVKTTPRKKKTTS